MIGVLGASGRIGGYVAAGLAERGVEARALVRRPDVELPLPAVHAGVRRIVKISGGAATLGPNGTTATAVAHWRSEQRIERAGLAFAFLRPSFYMQNLLAMVAPGVAARGVCSLNVPVSVAARALRRRGLPPFELEHAARMTAYVAAGSDAAVTDHVARLTGRPPRSAQDFLAEHRSAFAPTSLLSRTLRQEHV